MSVLQERLNMLGRILTMFQATANAGMPVVVLLENMRTIHKVSGELVDELAREDPSASVHIDPFLNAQVEGLILGDLPEAPDHLPEGWDQP